ncbi:MAG: T9SS type A sorting domain-containing protein [Bacteroidales bacterium]|jgi:hypothetical protein|nr:T9SS type A sorting domain-containing protein [Bacteroidales bacterium]
MKKNLPRLIITALIVSTLLISCKNKNENHCFCVLRDREGFRLGYCNNNETSEDTVSDVVMFPNPASDIITLEFFTINQRIITVKNSGGKEMKRDSTSEVKIHIDISNYPKGRYVVIIDDGKKKTKLCLIKNNES